MKKIALFFFRLIFLVILLIALFFYLANPLVSSYDYKIRETIKNTYSENVNYQKIKLRGFPLPSVVIHGLSYKKGLNFSVNIPKLILYVNPFNLFWNRSHLVWAAKVIDLKVDLILQEKENFNFFDRSYNQDTTEDVFGINPRFERFNLEFDKNYLDLFLKEISLHNIDLFNGDISIWDAKSKVKKIEKINLHSKLEVENSFMKLTKTHYSGNFITSEKSVYNFGGRSNIIAELSKNSIVIDFQGRNYLKNKKMDIFQVISPIDARILFNINENLISSHTSRVNFSTKGNVEINNATLDIVPFYSKINPALYFNLDSQDLKFSNIIEVRDDLRVWDLHFAKEDLKITLDKLEYFNKSTINFDQLNIDKKKNNLSLSGNLDLEKKKYKLLANSKGFNLSDLKYFIDLPSVVLVGELELIFDDKTSVKSKEFSFRKFKEKHFSIKSGLLKDFNLEYKSGKLSNLETSINFASILARYPEEDRYTAKRVVGTIKLNESDSYNCSSNLDVRDFSYTDSNVKLSETDIVIKNLIAKYTEKNGLSVNLDAESKKLKLSSKNIEIFSIQNLIGPVQIKVSQEGNYLVESKAKATEANMNISSKNILASGDVNFVLNEKNKTFLSNSITGFINTRPYSLIDTNFEILPLSYDIKKTTLVAFNGQTKFSSIFSRENPSFSLNISSENLSLKEFAFVLPEDKRENISGNMKKLKLDLTGMRGRTDELNGQIQVDFEKGKLKKLELDEVLGGPVQGSSSKEGTYVENLKFDAAIKNGVMSAEDFILAARFYTFKGSGTYSFQDGFKVKGNAVYLEETLSELGGPIKILRKLIGSLIKVQIPVKIKGPASDPEVDADLSRVMSILSPGRAVQSIGQGVEDIFGGIKDVVAGK